MSAMIFDSCPVAAIVACGAEKLDRPAPACELYIGPLFRARKERVESLGIPWWIYSAKYGLIPPERMIEPYELKLAQHKPAVREESGLNACNRLAMECYRLGFNSDPLRAGGKLDREPWNRLCVEIHAGQEYVFALLAGNHDRFAFSWPTKGMQIGEQLAFYKALNEGARRKAA